MTITPSLFAAFLKCPSKCWLRAANETPSGNPYAEWVQSQNESYRASQAERLLAAAPPGESVHAPSPEKLKASLWRLAVDVAVQANLPAPSGGASSASTTPPAGPSSSGPRGTRPAEGFALETSLHAVERVAAEGRGKAAQFIPIRFTCFNKLTRDDKLLLGFDACVLSAALGREITAGKLIHGDDHATLKVKTAAQASEVRKRLGKLAALLASPTPPDLVLNRHCGECEFQARCRKIALEKDDLSLLGGMSAKERQKLRSKGIFTVTQLSYTFRPRRRPKKQRDKREKYHHSLKALAIREKKIHIVGSPELKIEGTPVYLDVEGLPDRDFYYLIGLRIGNGEAAVQHSLWADSVADEGKIWLEFLAILETVEKPVLVHYGRYETIFLKALAERYGIPRMDSVTQETMRDSLNLVSLLFARIYFPTFSNGLKEIASWLGFKWFGLDAVGPRSVAWRHVWEASRDSTIKTRLVSYNAEDCDALALVVKTLSCLGVGRSKAGPCDGDMVEIAHVDDFKPSFAGKWCEFSSPVSDLELVNKAAYWDYQRDRIYIGSRERTQRDKGKSPGRSKSVWTVDKVVDLRTSGDCPSCHRKGVIKGRAKSQTVQDIVFGRFSLKRRVITYKYQVHWCPRCNQKFGFAPGLSEGKRPGGRKYGTGLRAFLFYQIIELATPQRAVLKILDRLFGLKLKPGMVATFKATLAADYAETMGQILKHIVAGSLVHVDETHVTIKRRRAYVWVFTSMHEVAYIYSDTREGDLLHETLRGFKGVAVSDFYTVYDSLDCPQQKCLIHLLRDLNDALLKDPYDEELNGIAKDFGQLLRTIVEEVDRRGLKKHFLGKHLRTVDRFYRKIRRINYTSPSALACRDRLEKNRNKLFTFLKYDGVPWNNNNAEHAIKAFARLREFIESGATEKGIRQYLVLLSICQTCKYMGVDFLDFLRSGKKDIHAFAESRRGRRHRSPSSEPKALPADASAEK